MNDFIAESTLLQLGNLWGDSLGYCFLQFDENIIQCFAYHGKEQIDEDALKALQAALVNNGSCYFSPYIFSRPTMREPSKILSRTLIFQVKYYEGIPGNLSGAKELGVNFTPAASQWGSLWDGQLGHMDQPRAYRAIHFRELLPENTFISGGLYDQINAKIGLASPLLSDPRYMLVPAPKYNLEIGGQMPLDRIKQFLKS